MPDDFDSSFCDNLHDLVDGGVTLLTRVGQNLTRESSVAHQRYFSNDGVHRRHCPTTMISFDRPRSHCNPTVTNQRPLAGKYPTCLALQNHEHVKCFVTLPPLSIWRPELHIHKHVTSTVPTQASMTEFVEEPFLHKLASAEGNGQNSIVLQQFSSVIHSRVIIPRLTIENTAWMS